MPEVQRLASVHARGGHESAACAASALASAVFFRARALARGGHESAAADAAARLKKRPLINGVRTPFAANLPKNAAIAMAECRH
jgi:hypothetical protein